MYDALKGLDRNYTSIERMKVNVSLNDVFRLAPKFSDFLLNCAVFMTNGTYVKHPGSQCDQFFDYTRYFMDNQLCYMFDYKLGGLYVMERIARESEGSTYGLWLNTATFVNLTFFRVIIHDKGVPFTSRFYANYVPAPGVVRGRGLTYQFSYATIEHKKLPTPYDTDCLPGATGRFECVIRCVINTIKKRFNRLTTAWPLTENNEFNFDYDLLLLYDSQLLQQSDVAMYEQLLMGCNGVCERDACEYQLSVTSMLTAFESDTIEIWFQLPVAPTTRIEHTAYFVMNDYIIYIMSCLGTWLGVSVIALSPYRFRKKSKNSTCAAERLLCVEEKHYRLTQQLTAMRVRLNQKVISDNSHDLLAL